MNKKRFAFIGVLLVVVLALAACAPQEEMPAEMPQEAEVEESMPAEEEMEVEEEMEAEEPMEEEAAEESMEDEMAGEVDVEALIEEKVAGQHDVERIFNATKTREEWEETLDRMIGYGAKINDEEKEIIINYLLEKGEMEAESEAMEIDVEALIAEKSASQHELGFILGQEKTREEWEETLDRMIGYGAKINEEEKQLIIDYLVSR